MNIVYATRATIPYASAASLNSVQMCQSLAELGHRVTLAIGRKFWRPGRYLRDWSDHYGFTPEFDVVKFVELPRTGWGFDGRILELARRQQALLYLRFPRLLQHPRVAGVASLLELHSGVSPGDRRQIAGAFEQGSLLGVIAITSALRNELVSASELTPYADRVFVAPDAVNCDRFADVRTELDLGQVGYVGSLFSGKGLERIVEIALRRPSIGFHVFGGRDQELRQWRRELDRQSNLRLWGYVPPAQVPACFDRFGIALLPNQPSVRLPNGDDIGPYTSPMKLFEYMAAGRAIVASDLPGLREVLRHEVNCLLVPHHDTQAWVRAIDRLRENPRLAERIAMTARQQACHEFSYHRRFENILDYFMRPLRRKQVA